MLSTRQERATPKPRLRRQVMPPIKAGLVHDGVGVEMFSKNRGEPALVMYLATLTTLAYTNIIPAKAGIQ
jgi:hypothetical protein